MLSSVEHEKGFITSGPGHPRSLINAFVIHSLGSIISKPASCKVSIIYLVSVAE